MGYVALCAALIVVVGGLAIAEAATVITTPETIVYQDHTVKYAELNLGSQAFGPGDSWMSTLDLFDETGTTQVGTGHIQCTTQPGRGWQFCVGAFITDRGQIFVSTALQIAPDTTYFDIPITGGTGDFANVRGYAHVVPKSRDRQTDTLYLLP